MEKKEQNFKIENNAVSVFDNRKLENALSTVVNEFDEKLTDHKTNTTNLVLSEVENINEIIQQERSFRKLQEQQLIELAIAINQKEIQLNKEIKNVKEDQTLTEKTIDDKILELTVKTKQEQEALVEQLSIETGHSKKDILNKLEKLEQDMISEYFAEKDREFEEKISDKMDAFKESKTFKFFSMIGANEEKLLDMYKKYQWDKENKLLEHSFVETEREKYEEFKEQKLKEKLAVDEAKASYEMNQPEQLNNSNNFTNNKGVIKLVDKRANEVFNERLDELKPQILKVRDNIDESMVKYETIKVEQEQLKEIAKSQENLIDYNKREQVIINNHTIENYNNIIKEQEKIKKDIATNKTSVSELNKQQLDTKKTMVKDKKDLEKYKKKTNRKINTVRKRVIAQYVIAFGAILLVTTLLTALNDLITAIMRPLFLMQGLELAGFNVLGEISEKLRSLVGPDVLAKFGIDERTVEAAKKNYKNEAISDNLKSSLQGYDRDKYLKGFKDGKNDIGGEAKAELIYNKTKAIWDEKAKDPRSKVSAFVNGNINDGNDILKEFVEDRRLKDFVEVNGFFDYFSLDGKGPTNNKSYDEQFVLDIINGLRNWQLQQNEAMANMQNVTNKKQLEKAKNISNDKGRLSSNSGSGSSNSGSSGSGGGGNGSVIASGGSGGSSRGSGEKSVNNMYNKTSPRNTNDAMNN